MHPASRSHTMPSSPTRPNSVCTASTSPQPNPMALSNPTTPSPSPTSLATSITSSRSLTRRSSAPDILSPLPDRALVPTVFVWAHDGQHVCVAGAWDQWSSRTTLYRNGNEMIALIYLPVGEYQFKYLVDDLWRCAPDVETRTDAEGNTNNVVTVVEREREFDSGSPLRGGEQSPRESYDQGSSGEFASDPPLLPMQLEERWLKEMPGEGVGGSRRTKRFRSHVFIDHLYREKVSDHNEGNTTEQQLVSFSQSSRVGDKVVDTVFITVNERRSDHRSQPNGFAITPF